MKPSQPNVDRSRFKREENPQLIARAAAMVSAEVGIKPGNRRAQIVQLETAFNRAQYRNHSLGLALTTTGESKYGYYPKLNRVSREQVEAFKREVWDPVMNGSNLSDVGWGPMTGNASNDPSKGPGGMVARNQFARGTAGYQMQGGDTYFREGVPPGVPLPAMTPKNLTGPDTAEAE